MEQSGVGLQSGSPRPYNPTNTHSSLLLQVVNSLNFCINQAGFISTTDCAIQVSPFVYVWEKTENV